MFYKKKFYFILKLTWQNPCKIIFKNIIKKKHYFNKKKNP